MKNPVKQSVAPHGRAALIVLFLLGAGQAFAQQPPPPSDQAPMPNAQAEERDPWEGWNRQVHAFNEFVDDWFLRPVAQGYRFITPSFVDNAITNFFTNLGEVNNFANSVLQLKGESAVVALGRFTYNTTFGLGGLFDVGTAFGLPERPEDMGQTLGYWGLGSGPYLVLPFLGPSSGRDFGGLAIDLTVMPSTWDYIESPENYYLRGLQLVDVRADLIPAESFMSGDSYTFVRNAYLQRREFLINDGEVKSDPFSSDDEDLMLENF